MFNKCLIVLLSIFSFWFSFGLGKPGKVALPAPHIVGGVNTDISEVPYQAALLVDDYYFCGAAIISEKFLVTGAHCIVFFYEILNLYNNDFIIRVGSNYSEKGGVVLKPKATACHPDFDFDNCDYDICLIEVEKPIAFNKNVRPIKISNFEPVGGEIGKVAGWGTLWEGGSSPEKLQSVNVPVTNRTFCKEAYEKINPITERMFCAGETGKDSCQGDSGGALAIDNALYGIISTGCGCGRPGFPGVYTNVAHPAVRKFIKKISGI